MSLRVWLPLTKDLRQQGLNSAIIEEATSAVFDNSGKLGKCLSGGKIKIPANQVASIFNNTAMSIAFWYNNNTTTNSNHAICGFSGNSEGDTDAVRIWDFFQYSTANDFHWSMGTLGNGILTGVFPYNTWTHVCVTFGNGILKIYINGVLQTTQTGKSSNYTFDKSYYISFGHTPQKLNEFRIYDHCLSPMEVKELAKGLVLHYPLNRQGWGQENLVRGTYDWNRWVASTRASFSADIATLTGSTADWGASIHSAHLNKALLDGTTTYTWSFEYKSTATWNCNPVIGGTATEIDATSSSRTKYCYWQSALNLPSTGGVWKKYILNSRTIAESQMTSGSGDVNSWFLQIYNRTDNVVVNIRRIKLETGSIATQWCPNSSDTLATTMGLNSTTEYDCSGFCNNGTRIGSLSWTSDTPKYEVSTEFNGTNATIDCGNGFHSQGAQELTFSCWVYSNNWGSGTAQYYLSSQETGGIIIQSISSSNNIRARIHAYTAADLSTYSYYQADCAYTNTGISGSGWHMLTGVYTTSSIKLYIDGILKKTTSLTTYGIHFNDTAHMFLAAESAGTTYSNLCNCKLSDVRIYATALSADDVKSLYQNCATIDPDGTIRGQIRS